MPDDNILGMRSPSVSKIPFREIVGTDVACLDWASAISLLGAVACADQGHMVVSFLNAHNANLAANDQKYRDVLAKHLVLPDGIGVDIASTMAYGWSFPANLNGTDLVPALFTSITKSLRIGIMGSTKAVAEAAASGFNDHAPWHEFVVVGDGFFSDADNGSVVQKIKDLTLDILVVGMGTPRQERWIDANIGPEHARLVFGVGALLDFAAGKVPRAPKWVRGLRMEWAWRLIHEPQRLFYRYAVGIPVFLVRAALSAISIRRRRRSSLAQKHLPYRALGPNR